MILYHGGTDKVEKPEIRQSDTFLDFGTGFYTTTSYDQAERWAKIKMRRKDVGCGYVSVYEFDLEAAEKAFKIKRFDSADVKWLTFVAKNRQGEPSVEAFDLHIGPVADDNVYRTIRLFETGVYDAEETVKRLKTEVLQNQWAMHTERILSLCKFVEARKILQEE